MATIRQRSSGAWEVVIRNKALPKPYYATLDTEEEARIYAAKLEARIKRGEIPVELTEEHHQAETIGALVARYVTTARVSAHDADVLGTLDSSILDKQSNQITVKWLLAWVDTLQTRHLSPGTIRKKVGAVARCLDWAVTT